MVFIRTKYKQLIMSVYDTIIVGMGAAGCAAAADLCHVGKTVLGLEAQNRIGGRVHTVQFGDGVIELGAEWIHGETPNAVFELANKHKVPIVSQNISFEVLRWSDGSEADNALINELLLFVFQAIDEHPQQPRPLGEYLTERITEYVQKNHPSLLKDKGYLTRLLRFLELVICNYDPSESWNNITTHNNYRTVEGDLHLSWHKTGYNTLFDIILNSFQNGSGLPSLDLKLQKVVSKIVYPEQSEKDVVVICDDGSEYRSRNVIVTVSLGVLKAKHQTLFSPPLPKPKIDAINSITIGVMDKIELLFPQRWWSPNQSIFGFLWKEEDLANLAVQDQWMGKIFGATCPKGSDNVLTLWTSGDTAKQVETLPLNEVKIKVMELLKRFLGKGKTIPEPTNIIRSTWHLNPYTRGSYTYDSVSAPLSPHARSYLAEPLYDVTGNPRVLFAGEATHNNHFSTVHGAIETGRREAARLLLKSKL